MGYLGLGTAWPSLIGLQREEYLWDIQFVEFW